MSHVIFVGDAPSAKNTDESVAFIGTPSHTTLVKWIEAMGIELYALENSHTDVLLMQTYHDQLYDGCVIVALGNKASERLNLVHIPHFKLPHPSPKNRKLNNKTYVEEQLRLCKGYIDETASEKEVNK